MNTYLTQLKHLVKKIIIYNKNTMQIPENFYSYQQTKFCRFGKSTHLIVTMYSRGPQPFLGRGPV